MNVKSALVVLLIAILLIDLGDSWLWRRRKRKPKVSRPCRRTCPRVCSITYRNGRVVSTRCRVRCRYRCGKKKREAIENEHLTPLPKYIEYYDLNDDGKVTAAELAATLGEIDFSKDMMDAFNITDTDHNEWLSEEELFRSTCLEFEIVFRQNVSSRKGCENKLQVTWLSPRPLENRSNQLPAVECAHTCLTTQLGPKANCREICRLL